MPGIARKSIEMISPQVGVARMSSPCLFSGEDAQAPQSLWHQVVDSLPVLHDTSEKLDEDLEHMRETKKQLGCEPG